MIQFHTHLFEDLSSMLTFDIVALFGAVPVRLSLISLKNFKTELLEL